MSDYRGRGRGRGGGRGGDRGGGGGFQGVGVGRGRGGGDFQGGGGGRGFHGGGGGRGRGRGGGGRGDGRGQGDDGGPPVYLGSSGSIPTPEPAMTKLEDDWIEKQTTSLGVGALSLSDAILPRRPQFGTRGVETVLWANYFRLKVNADSLWKYDVKVMPTKVTKAEQDAKDNKKREDKTPGGQPGDGAEGCNEVKGQKLAKIIQLALGRLPSEAVVATEYKQQVVSLKKLELPADNFIEVVLSEPPRKPETWFVRFDGPLSIDVSALMQYLQTLEDTAHETVFPKFPDEIDALGVVLGHTPRSDPSTTAVGRNRFFAFDSRRVDKALPVDKNFLEFLRGYVQSVRPATGRLLLNVNVTAGVFRRGFPLLAYLQNERINMKEWTDDAFDKAGLSKLHELHKVLARSRIRCKAFDEKKKSFTLSVERTVAGLARNGDGPSAREEKPRFRFPKIGYGTPWTVKFKFRAPKTPGAQPPPGLQFDTEMSVGQYFQARYGYIARADLPLVNVGTRAKPVYIPAEFCEVLPGQPLKTKLTAADQAAMINFACRSPGPNARSVTGKARLVLSLDNNNLLDKFHISVDRELITVKGRELAPPVISYQGGKKQSPANGGWNMRGVRVCKTGGKQQISWAFASLGSRRFQRQTVGDSFKRFVEFLRDNQGIPLDKNPVDPRGTHHEWYTEGEVHKMFKAIQGLKTRPNLVLIALEDKDTNAYTWVKKLGDVEFGFMTVCCRHDQLAKGSPAYIANVGLKVNLKFGGTNHLVTDSTGLVKDTMFVGYDVTHPTNLSAGASENAPSFVGMVASINADLAQWPAVAWENQSRVEQVGKDDQGQFVNNFKDRILLWQKHNGGKLPPNIVIFRDGVSEGQFRMVLDEELPQIRQACQVTYPKGQKQPKISLIVSVKRHQTRFYPTKPDNIHADSKSPKEGTVVDRGVTNVRYWDFFLQAHASLQGTARPAHYTVLLDEIFRERFKDKAASMLEQLTHDMCYAYNRATKAVGICPPAYYADLVCTRARIHKDELFRDEDVDSSTTSQQADRLTVSRRQVHPNLKDTMYYV